jgi:5-dehydro-2-deoxygluconokinase
VTQDLDVLCIGQSAVDIFCDSLERIPKEGEFWLLDRIEMFPGGCPTNTAIVTSRLNLRTCLVTAIGNDSFGTFLKNEFEKCKIMSDAVVVLDGSCTGKSVILLVKDKDRMLLHEKGVNEEFCIEHIDFGLIDRTNVVFLSAYISGLPKLGKDDVIRLFKYARNRKKTTILDLLIDPREKEPMFWLTGLMEYTDYLILNDDEGKLLTGAGDYKEQADELIKSGAGNVVIKLGKKGSYFKNKEHEYEAHPFEVEQKDPTGAGDAFNGGLIYGLIKKWNIEKILRFANIVGASAVTRLGCTAGVSGFEDMENILEGFSNKN